MTRNISWSYVLTHTFRLLHGTGNSVAVWYISASVDLVTLLPAGKNEATDDCAV